MSEPGAKPVALRFPRLAARDLEGRVHSLPYDFAGTRNLVVVAFRREQQSMVETRGSRGSPGSRRSSLVFGATRFR